MRTYCDLPILFQNSSLYNINNQLVQMNVRKKSHCRVYFRGTNLMLKEHEFLWDLTFALETDWSDRIVRLYLLTSISPPRYIRNAATSSRRRHFFGHCFILQLPLNSRLLTCNRFTFCATGSMVMRCQLHGINILLLYFPCACLAALIIHLYKMAYWYFASNWRFCTTLVTRWLPRLYFIQYAGEVSCPCT